MCRPFFWSCARGKQPCVESGLPWISSDPQRSPCKPCGSTAEYFSIAVSDHVKGRGEDSLFSVDLQKRKESSFQISSSTQMCVTQAGGQPSVYSGNGVRVWG